MNILSGFAGVAGHALVQLYRCGEWFYCAITLATFKDLGASLQSWTSFIALVVAAVWFFYARGPFQRADLEHRVTHRRFESGNWWLRVEVRFANRGLVLLRPKVVDVRVYQALPLVPGGEVARYDRAPDKPASPRVPEELPWPLLDVRLSQRGPKEKGLEVSPNETEGMVFDFVLPANLRTVLIYSHVAMEMKDDAHGWVCNSTYELDDPPAHRNNEASSQVEAQMRQDETEERKQPKKPLPTPPPQKS